MQGSWAGTSGAAALGLWTHPPARGMQLRSRGPWHSPWDSQSCPGPTTGPGAPSFGSCIWKGPQGGTPAFESRHLDGPRLE